MNNHKNPNIGFFVSNVKEFSNLFKEVYTIIK